MSWEATDLLEALDESICVLACDGTFVYVNASAARVMRLPRETIIGKRLLEMYPDSPHDVFQAAVNRVAATGESEQIDNYYPPWDRWFRSKLYRIADHVHVITRDITEHRRADARLHALARASHAFGHAQGLDELFTAIATTLAELVGDACLVRIVEDGTWLRPVAVHHTIPERLAILRDVLTGRIHAHEGLTARVLETGEPVLVAHIDPDAHRQSFIDPPRREQVDLLGLHSTIAAPLRDGEKRIGVVTMVRDRTPAPYTPDDLSLLHDLAERASMALTRTQLFEESQRERRRALAIASASRAFSAAERDTHAILDLLARTASAEVGEIAVANVLDLERRTLRAVAFHPSPELTQDVQATLTAETPIAGSLSERVVATGRPLRLAHIDVEAFAASTSEQHGTLVRRFQPHSFIMVPIKRGTEVIGTLTASRQRSTVPYSDAEEQLLEELADRAALSIENARVLEAERVARQAAERIAAQTRRLQAIGSLLSHRRPPADIAQTILRESIAVLGDTTGAIWLLDPAGTRLEMLASVGYEQAQSYSTLPVSAEIPMSHAVRSHEPVYLATRAEYAARFPLSAQRVGDYAPPEFASACLPLVSEGRALGGLVFTFRHAHDFIADERTFLEVLASQCAQAIDRARLLEQERAASAALAESNRTLNTVIHASPAAIVISELDGVIRLWNPAAERIFGWTASETIGHRFPVAEDSDDDVLFDTLERIGRGDEVRGHEMGRVRKDGTPIDVALWATPVVRPGGHVQALAVFVDVTDRMRAEQVARAADRRKDEFLAMLGHELRNPLAPILTALDLMRIRGETGGERERAMIERQTRHLVRLVDDLLDIERITRGKIELRKTRTDLAAVIAAAVEMASPLLEQRNHHVSIVAPRNLAFVDGDEFRLAQVFQNLTTNAAKYTPSGGSITVRLTLRGDQVVVEVEDNGEGIAPEMLPTIFQPFVQGTRKVDRSQGGLGIGLTLVRSLTELHGGRVEAHSAGPGLGSRFTVQLPLSGGVADDAHDVPPPRPLRGARRRVLLVDDNRDAAEMMAELLRAAGHEVLVAFDGASALGRVPAFVPDVALLDIGLPLMDGYDLARRLKSALPALPRLIALSGFGQEHDHLRSQQAGFAAHLVKPVQAAQVLAAVDAGD